MSDLIILMDKKENICFVLLPGFAPDDFPVFGLRNILEERGYRVIVSSFYGSSKIKDFSKLSAGDMINGSSSVINRAVKKYEKVVGIGISLGGALFLEYAKQNNLAAIISVGTPLRLKQRSLINFSKIIYPFIYPFWHHIEKRHANFRLLPIGAGKTVVNYLENDFLLNLDRINSPILFLHSKKDWVADYRYLQEYTNQFSSKNKKIILFNNGGHIINRDARLIVDNALNFINSIKI